MKCLYMVSVLTIVLFTVVTLSPLQATNLSAGEKIFNANCSTCHMGGNNIVIADKSLRKEDLEKYGMDSLPAIKQRVKLGYRAMPAFGKRMSASQIEIVAVYVLQQSNQGW